MTDNIISHYRVLDNLGGGMGIDGTTEAQRISAQTVRRDWDLARAWLYCELNGNKQNG